MLQSLMTFFAGAFTIGVTVFVAGGRPSSAGFLMGFLLAVILAAAALSSTPRLRRAARFLNALAHALDQMNPAEKGHRKRKTTAEPEPEAQRNVYEALLSLGASKPAARAAAAYAIDKEPDAQFSDLLRIAVNRTKAAA